MTPARGEARPASRPRPRPERLIRWLSPPPSAAHPHAVFRITEVLPRKGPQIADYFVREIRHPDLGPGQRGFEVTKLTPHTETSGSSYAVLLSPDGRHSCECKGWLRWGHQTLCRHVGGLLALLGTAAAQPGA